MSREEPDEAVLISADGYEQRHRELDRLRDEARRELSDRCMRRGTTATSTTTRAARPARGAGAARAADRDCSRRSWRPPRSSRRPATAAPESAASCASATVDGATVEYELVGPLEADIDTGRVSIAAPVGQALLGRRAGAHVDVTAPGGRHTLEVVAVRPRRTVIEEAA